MTVGLQKNQKERESGHEVFERFYPIHIQLWRGWISAESFGRIGRTRV